MISAGTYPPRTSGLSNRPGEAFQRGAFAAVLLIRVIFFVVAILLVGSLFTPGTSQLSMGLAASIGVLVATGLVYVRASVLGFILIQAALLSAIYLGGLLANLVTSFANDSIYGGYTALLHRNLLVLIYLVAAVSTYGFWRIRGWASLEVLTAVYCAIVLFSGHRQFHFDRPKIIESWAWYLGVNHLALLIGVGSVLALLVLAYLGLAYIATQVFQGELRAPSSARTSYRTTIQHALTGLVVIVVTLAVSYGCYKFFFPKYVALIGNGVGQATEEGLTPLGFHSALGSTKQPAALVRLEGDYPQNPHTPMLFFREAALSDFNGRELVIASKDFDRDVNRSAPGEAWEQPLSWSSSERVRLEQSIYLLGKHRNVFAIDFPVRIRPISNPKPDRFLSAYRAVSLVPSFPLRKLLEHDVGDPSWSQAEWEHYLKTHPDERYTNLAAQITDRFTSPIGKAAGLAQYLADSSIYTLTPNHDVDEADDPVAPYLFGDRRGYCVHFSHAVVYMLRSQNIPARIGTGYLTDLSQSKDGHILLRMSDRHAWAEVYVRSIGWVPFDVQPTQVETHADSPVDKDLLDELMGMLEPGEEILPETSWEDESVFQETPLSWPVYLRFSTLLGIIAALLIWLLVVKLYLRWSWVFVRSERGRLSRAYLALFATLRDLGFSRYLGETRAEFTDRLARSTGQSALTLPGMQVNTVYQPSSGALYDISAVREALKGDLRTLRELPLWRRLWSWINPASVFEFLGRARWCWLVVFAFGLLAGRPLHADIQDPFDPFDRYRAEESPDDQNKSAEVLMSEAEILFLDERWLDGRNRLLRALEKNPELYPAHRMLSAYYLTEVGHFKLALKYARRALELFKAANGEPPYRYFEQQMQHADFLHLLSQARLNLDDYEGALKALDQYAELGYVSDWYHASRAWILMKLGRLHEATLVARSGELQYSDPGRLMNVLGIVLSMSGKRQESIGVFEQAILVELSRGRLGQPATPLNNMGEVYNEIFEENRAESSWLRAMGMSDGCEHVLPSLNLTLLYLNQLKLRQAAETLTRFESCFAQYPLRRGDEHKALIHLARGRINLLAGNSVDALKHFDAARELKQWFGKIGASAQDLEAATLISTSQALRVEARQAAALTPSFSLSQKVHSLKNNALAWWFMRRAIQILTEDLNDLEDLRVRHTDSLVDYATLGDALERVPTEALRKQIAELNQEEYAAAAQPYYNAYLAQNLLAHGREREGQRTLQKTLESTRPVFDEALRLHLLLLALDQEHEGSDRYRSIVHEIFRLSPASLLNAGKRLPVRLVGQDGDIAEQLEETLFIGDSSPKTPYTVRFTNKSGQYILQFEAKDGMTSEVRVRGENLEEAGNEFIHALFRKEIKSIKWQ